VEFLLIYSTLGLEKDLRRFLASNPDSIEKGLVLVEDGEEYDTHEVGIIDLLLKDSSGTLVVVELKRRKTGDTNKQREWGKTINFYCVYYGNYQILYPIWESTESPSHFS